MLLLAPFSEPDPMAQLKARAAALSLPAWIPVVMGVVFVDEERRLSLGAPGLTGQMLENLATWVSTNVGAQPELAVLKDASLVVLDAQGTVRARHRDPGLWAAIPRPPRRAEVDRSIQRLQELTPGPRRCWFWVTDAGLGGKPSLVMRPLKSAESSARFSELVGSMRLQCAPEARSAQGSVLRSQNGRLVFTVARNLVHTPAIFAALVEHAPALGDLLAGACVVRVDSGADPAPVLLLPAQTTPDPDTAAALAAMKTDDTLYFWFTDQDRDNEPSLLLRQDTATLKDAARNQKGEGQSLRGTLTLQRAGWGHFRAERDAPWFLQALHGWTARHSSTDTARLHRARLSCQAADGSLIARYRNDALWESAAPDGG